VSQNEMGFALAQTPLDPKRAFRASGSRPTPSRNTLGINATECYLLRVFLRRYVTWCARRRRFAAMQGAWRPIREVCALPSDARRVGQGAAYDPATRSEHLRAAKA